MVLLKDTALGYIVAFEDLLNAGARVLPSNFSNLIPAVIVIAIIYVSINMALGAIATWLEKSEPSQSEDDGPADRPARLPDRGGGQPDRHHTVATSKRVRAATELGGRPHPFHPLPGAARLL